MFQFLYLTQLSFFLTLLFLIVFILLAYDYLRNTKQKLSSDSKEPPSPRSYPIIGHLHLLSGYEVPYQAFTELAKKYGSIIKLKLGNVNCVVVNEFKNIKEVLITRGHHFDSRPNFERYQHLFYGNKEYSLAFCDWSKTQKARRDMLRAHTFPRASKNKFQSLEDIISKEITNFMDNLEGVSQVKPLILQLCGKIFLSHFCSKSFSSKDKEFLGMVENYDDIFWEVNQGYAADFLPFLLPLHQKNLNHISNLTHKIRQFILDRVIEDRFHNFGEEEPSDYVESLIKSVKTGEVSFSWDTSLFALEDIIGGHSAVGNFVMKLFGFLVKEQEVQRKIQEELDSVAKAGRNITISDRTKLPYTEAVIFEAVRLIASPIIPRVANQDSFIDGYKINKGSVIFLNNYELSMSEDLWEEPTKFKPERFVTGGRFVKPEHFLPFGGGRRSCMGYKIMQWISFCILSRLLQNYTIMPVDSECYKVPIGSLALPKNTFSFRFVRR